MNNLISPIKRILPSKCPICGNDTIVIYDINNKRINYHLLCKYNTFDKIENKLKNTNLKYMKCDSCKSKFILDWTKKEIPYPITNNIYIKFEI